MILRNNQGIRYVQLYQLHSCQFHGMTFNTDCFKNYMQQKTLRKLAEAKKILAIKIVGIKKF